MKAHFYVVRHGDKDGDMLTTRGQAQVKVAARQHLKGLKFLITLYSGLNRALETVQLMLQELGQTTPITAEAGVGLAWAQGDELPKFSYESAKRRLQAQIGGRQPTVYDWLEHWPLTWGFRAMMIEVMKRWTVQLAVYGDDEVNILVGSHGPIGEMAAPLPRSTPALEMGDIAHYVVEYDRKESPKIVCCSILPCPPITIDVTG